MLIFRYLARDLLSSTFAVCTVLLLVILSGRFVKYLAQAAAGELDAGILLAVIGYRLPGFLELILPLAFFLGILCAKRNDCHDGLWHESGALGGLHHGSEYSCSSFCSLAKP